MNELAARLFLDKSTASRVVDALERKGLIRRLPHPEDRRALRLSSTPAGKRLHARITREIHDREMGVLAEFGPEVREAMIDVISRLARAAERRVQTTGGTCCCLDC